MSRRRAFARMRVYRDYTTPSVRTLQQLYLYYYTTAPSVARPPLVEPCQTLLTVRFNYQADIDLGYPRTFNLQYILDTTHTIISFTRSNRSNSENIIGLLNLFVSKLRNGLRHRWAAKFTHTYPKTVSTLWGLVRELLKPNALLAFLHTVVNSSVIGIDDVNRIKDTSQRNPAMKLYSQSICPLCLRRPWVPSTFPLR